MKKQKRQPNTILNLYKRGYTAELGAIRTLRNQGYEVIRSAKSYGPADLVAVNHKEMRLIQVKSTKDPNPANFKKDIERLAQVKTPANCKKEIWIKEFKRAWHYHKIEDLLETKE